MIIAHRGLHTKEEENTIPAFESALKAGADAIETDLCLVQDGTCTVYHDFKVTEKREDDLTIDDLCKYIKKKNAQFFLELKLSSPRLAKQVVAYIEKYGIWKKVFVLAFESNAKAILKLQTKYPKLRVIQILTFGAHGATKNEDIMESFTPASSVEKYLAKLPRCYGISVGWHEEVLNSKKVFKAHFPSKQLKSFRMFAESLGYVVFAGVPNTQIDAKYFFSAGIHAIFTDRPDIISDRK